MAHILIAAHVQAAQISIEAGGAITLEGGGGSSRIDALEAEVAALRGEHNRRLLALEAALAAPSMPPPAPCVPDVGTITSCSASEEHATAPGYYCNNAYDGQTAAYGSHNDGGISWATNGGDSVGQWINLVFDQPTTINTMEYANRDAHIPGPSTATTAHASTVDLLFSDGTTTRVDGIANTGSSTHRFPAVVTTSVRVTVVSATAGAYVGAEEITFSQTCS